MIDNFVLKSKAMHRPRRLGRLEIVLLCLALGAMSSAIFLYVRIALNERETRETRQNFERNRDTLQVLKVRVDEIEQGAKIDLPTPETIRASLVKFEEDYLIPQAEGQSAVILEVNRLARESGVILSEINFNPIEEKDLRTDEGGAVGRRAGRSLFPGLEMTFTVEGSYADVRGFLAGLENSKAFLIITSQELKSVEPSGSRARPGLGAAPNTAQVITLGIKLGVYFERQNL